ncbi:Tropinone reductase 2 [Fusarium oxysporum f. sp. cubense race 1]|uniref:Tropinone reductase 2 n=1 Tax=Fusarium oxysporum f. sp. cubense (strain race 1) TaxID=1229664 RepID=N4UDX8_FUSC1|nr:Tropinone reductase 2 [Fusarium oxysporum f. sp. cubense race 1]
MTPATTHINPLAGSRVLVLGGTGGIGYGVALASLANGTSVFITGSTADKVASTVTQLREAHPQVPADNINGAPVDLANLDMVEKNLTELLDKVKAGGPINHIVHVAGDLHMMPHVSKITTDDLKQGLSVRFAAAVILGKIAPKYLDISSKNSIVLTSGTASAQPYPGRAIMTAYATLQEGLGKGLAVDLHPLRVNVISPGAVKTPLLNVFVPPEQIEAFLKNLADQTVTKEVGLPEWVAEAYIYAMKDRYCTGTAILSDGGRSIAPAPYLGQPS